MKSDGLLENELHTQNSEGLARKGIMNMDNNFGNDAQEKMKEFHTDQNFIYKLIIIYFHTFWH